MADFKDRRDGEDELDRELRAALHPLPAPAGFADKVIARSRELPRRRRLVLAGGRKDFYPLLRWSVAAMLLLAVTLGGVLEHQRQRRIAGEHARQQVLLALRITSFTLRAVRNRVDKNSTN